MPAHPGLPPSRAARARPQLESLSLSEMLAGYDHLLAAARRLQWDAEAIDLTADMEQLGLLDRGAQATLAQLVSGFRLAEQAVARELAPYVAATPPGSAARECFTVQAADEARHARFFERVAGEVLEPAGLTIDATRAPEAIRSLFTSELPAAARALAADAGRIDEAVGLYHLVLEGIVFTVGQEALLGLAGAGCDVTPRLPGIAAGTARVGEDERWHVGLGVLHLQRLGTALDAPAWGERVTARAQAAARAWGPAIATPERVARALAVHERRLAVARR